MSQTVLTISDAHTVHCLTEGHIDEWWRSLPTARKVEIFEAELESRGPESDADFTRFDAHMEQFLAEMTRLHRSPFAGLATPNKESAHEAL